MWLENLHDWCVSRQRKWGCPIPIEGETDTLDTFVDSSFYYIRYCDNTNENELKAYPIKNAAQNNCAAAMIISFRLINYLSNLYNKISSADANLILSSVKLISI